MENTQKENRLASETSPYLLQHKHNPVDWYPWGREAIEKSQRENKSILLSIGYSSCHWCHVMAHESFEDNETALLMNNFFINIKVDREERPDIDQIYMEAVQMLAHHGGWPLTVFLTPTLKPFYGGTYFPPAARHGLPSFKQVLLAVSDAYQKKKEEIEILGSQIIQNLNFASPLPANDLSDDQINLNMEDIVQNMLPQYGVLLEHLESTADKFYGGFGRSPKFPEPSKISAFLLSREDSHIAHSILTLDKIRSGGITDQVGGGISRYSVDRFWLVPHFEKMLYDNAQIIPLYAYASLILSEKNNSLSHYFKQTVNNIFDYLERDMKSPAGLYFSAEDADSEGEEGLFYLFSYDEVNELFKDDERLKEFVINFYKVTKQGNFEGKNILTIPDNLDQFCIDFNFKKEEINSLENQAKVIFLKARAQKARPGLDDKCLLSWNALLATGFLQAASFLNDKTLFKSGLALIKNMLKIYKQEESFKHTYKNNELKIEAFADDMAFLLEACTEALLLTGCTGLIKEIKHIINHINNHFIEHTEGIFYYTAKQTDLVSRPVKLEDNVIYSPHAALLNSLIKLQSWLNGTKNSHLIEANEHKKMESILLTCVRHVATLVSHAPLACAKFLQHLQWFHMKNVVILQPENNTPSTASLSCLQSVYKNLFLLKVHYTVVGCHANNLYTVDSLDNYSYAMTEENVTYSFCNKNGCQLPASDLTCIFNPV